MAKNAECVKNGTAPSRKRIENMYLFVIKQTVIKYFIMVDKKILSYEETTIKTKQRTTGHCRWFLSTIGEIANLSHSE